MADQDMIGKYRLLRPIAQGGMAEIFLARQEGTAGFSQVVVVKRVLPHLAQHREFVEMFLDEARLVAQLSHPNIVHIFDFGEVDGVYYLAMENLVGEDVGSILRTLRAADQVVPAQMTALIATHVLEGLSYAHTLTDGAGEPLGIVHRDVSPSNIMVTFQGAVKLLDFGIAKAAGKVVQTEAGKVKGKFMYMSPEQARGAPIDARSDLFAVSTVMYEMVTGMRPFQRENQLATLLAVTEEPIPSPRDLRPDLPTELEDIIVRGLNRDVEKRFQSALEMRLALDEFLATRTYAPAHAQLQQFLVDTFGEAHVAERKRPQMAASPAPATGTGEHEEPPRAGPGDGQDIIDQETRIGDSVTAAATPGAGNAGMETWVRSGAVNPGVSPGPRKAHRGFRTGLYAAALVAAIAGVAMFAIPRRTKSEPDKKVAPQPVKPVPPKSVAVAVKPKPAPARPVAVPSPPARHPQRLREHHRHLEHAPAPAGRPRKARHPSVERTRRHRPPRAVAPRPLRGSGSNSAPAPPPPKAAPPESPEKGTLAVNCIPYCRIYVDGKDTGLTSPARSISLSAGVHTLKVVNPPSHLQRYKQVRIAPGKTSVAVIHF